MHDTFAIGHHHPGTQRQRCGHLAACQWLLAPLEEGGAGLGLRHVGPDIEGDTPANLAKSNGHSAVEQWLLAEQSRLQLEDTKLNKDED